MAHPASLSEIAAFARRHDPDRFLSALFAPVDRREALFALIAYNHELARAREAARTPLVALMRLQWWREAVAQVAAGGPCPRHEVATPLQGAIAAGLLDAADLIGLADAREAEAEEGGVATEAALHAYLRGTAGGFAVATGRLLAAPAGSLPALQAAGATYGLAGVLRSVPALARQGRCLLPGDALAGAGLTPEAVVADPGSAAVRGIIAGLAEGGRLAAASQAKTLRGLPRSACAAALPLVLARRDLRRLALGWPGPAERGVGDRLAVVLAGLRGRI